MLRATNLLYIFTKQFIQWSCYLGKRRYNLGVVVCHAKKKMKLSKVGRLWPLPSGFVLCMVSFYYLLRDNMAQILKLWKVKCIIFHFDIQASGLQLLQNPAEVLFVCRKRLYKNENII